jgi:hypothetical protein
MLEECTTEEKCSLVRFLWEKGSMKRIFIKKCLLFIVWKCLLHKAALNWVKKFTQGHSKVAGDSPPGYPVEVVTEATVVWVEELIRSDRRIATDSVATALGCSYGLTYSIMLSESVHMMGAQDSNR